MASLSGSIAEHARRFKPFLSASVVALYLPFDNEVDTSSLLHAFHVENRTLCLPVVAPEKKLNFTLFSPGDPLQCGKYGIQEPRNKVWVDINQIDLLFMPLLGFDRFGTRLGYGGGYYDRALSLLSTTGVGPMLTGLAYDFQEATRLPCDLHDVPLHFVVTPSGVRSLGS